MTLIPIIFKGNLRVLQMLTLCNQQHGNKSRRKAVSPQAQSQLSFPENQKTMYQEPGRERISHFSHKCLAVSWGLSFSWALPGFPIQCSQTFKMHLFSRRCSWPLRCHYPVRSSDGAHTMAGAIKSTQISQSCQLYMLNKSNQGQQINIDTLDYFLIYLLIVWAIGWGKIPLS